MGFVTFKKRTENNGVDIRSKKANFLRSCRSQHKIVIIDLLRILAFSRSDKLQYGTSAIYVYLRYDLSNNEPDLCNTPPCTIYQQTFSGVDRSPPARVSIEFPFSIHRFCFAVYAHQKEVRGRSWSGVEEVDSLFTEEIVCRWPR
jgi:hypothetical protein